MKEMFSKEKVLPVEFLLNPAGERCKIIVDGEDISRFVTGIKIEASIGELTRMTVEFVNLGIVVSGTGLVAYVEKTAVGSEARSHIPVFVELDGEKVSGKGLGS